MKGRIKRDEQADPRLGLPIIGTVRIGAKNEKGYPMALDYFIAQGKYAGLFKQAYGEKPATIQIVFPSSDAMKVCCESYEYRNDLGQLIAKGDGETFKVWNGKAFEVLSLSEYPNIMESVTKRYPNKKAKAGGDGWDVTLRLVFILPMVSRVAGLWKFETKGSASSIRNIVEAFD